MRWTVLGLHTLALALACGPSGGTSTSTDAATSDTMTGGPGTTAGADTSGSTGNSTTNGDPTGPGTTVETTAHGPTTGAATEAASGGPGSTGDTGGSLPCAIVNDGDYGECDYFLGWAFDGLECRPVTGCECAPDCDNFFPDSAGCGLACAAAGECVRARIEGKYLGKNPVEVGDLCDEVHACLAGPDISPAALEAIWGAQTCQAEPKVCETESWCQSPFGGELDAEMFQKMCAASLLAGVDKVYCIVWGP